MKFVLSGILMFVFVYVGCEQQQSVTAPDLTSSGRQFVEMLAGGDYAKVFETFDAAMKDAMPVGQIDAAWQSLVAKVGAFQEIADGDIVNLGFVLKYSVDDAFSYLYGIAEPAQVTRACGT